MADESIENGAQLKEMTELESQIVAKSKENWEKSKPILEDWKTRLEGYQTRHDSQIRSLISEFSTLFGRPAPTEINVDLHFKPVENSTKGEPARGLAEAMRLPESDSDVFYWLGEFKRLPNDGPEQIEAEERMITTKIIHEDIHHDLQREHFQKVVATANSDPEIATMRQELMAGQANYLEPEAEMIAIYLEHYADHRLKEVPPETEVPSQPPIHYRLKETRFHEIFKAVVMEDYSWKQDGPYTSLRRGWGLPDILRESSAPSHENTIGPSIYGLGEKITDFSLFERYNQEGKTLDLDFIKGLYRLFLEQKRKPS